MFLNLPLHYMLILDQHNLYYIYTDYPKEIIQDLSLELRSQILGQKQNINNWRVFWGEEKDGWFMPSLSQSEKSHNPYYLPVVIVSEPFQYPAMLSPRVGIRIDILPIQSAFQPDLRPDIISGFLVRGGLIEKGDLDNAAEYTIKHPEEDRSLNFNKTLAMSSVSSKILNPGEVVGGIGLSKVDKEQGRATLGYWLGNIFGEMVMFLKQHKKLLNLGLIN